MKNILLILKHEYITRVSKKSFIIMTLLGPVLIAAFYGSIALLSYYQFSESKAQTVAVHDPMNLLEKDLKPAAGFEFNRVNDTAEAIRSIKEQKTDILLDILPGSGDSVVLISGGSLSISDKQSLRSIISDAYFSKALSKKGLSESMIDSMRHDVKITDILLSGKSSATEIKSAIGYIGAIIIYMFIFMYGVMIMRGVTEEKNNRIVEIIISAVRPFELMMGKILGVALVGLTQFMAWVFLSGLFVTVLSLALGAEMLNDPSVRQGGATISSMNQGPLSEILAQINDLNFAKLIFGFIIFFFGGFLLYSSLFAAIGSAVDSDTETQQFMFPVSMPLIFGLVIAQIAIVKDPNSSLAFWSSMIPFTSPVVMMVRLPFDVSWTQLFVSASILFVSFILMVWLAGRIYRIGILSYGQKASYKQMFKWLLMKG